MSAPDPRRLLEQAWHLVQRGRRPRQVDLRRAVSAAYYAVFHLLIRETVRSLVRSGDAHLRALLPRAFDHAAMAQACRTFVSGGKAPAILDAVYGNLTIPKALETVAQAFIDLQKARHDADYATHRRWTRTMAVSELNRAEQALTSWNEVRPKPRQPAATDNIARLFLVWLAFQKALQNRA